MAYRRTGPNEGRRARDRFDSHFDYQNRRDGETDRRDRPRDFHRSGSRSLSPDRERNYREREKERDRDRSRDLENPRPPPGPRENRPQYRNVSSPVHNKSGNSADPRLNRGPEPSPLRVPTVPTTPASSAPSTPHLANDSSSMAKFITALRLFSQRSNELGALQLQKDVVEARARARETEHAQSHPKYAEFPSLKDYHRKLEKKDAEDLNALCKEVGIADKQWLTAAEGVAALFQTFAERQQQEKDDRSAVPGSEDLETKLNSRIDALDKRHREEVAKQKKQIEDLQKGLSIETAQRKKLDIENETLKQKVQDLQNKHISLTAKVDEQDTLIKRLQDEKSKAVPPPPATQNTITSEDLVQVKTMVDQCRTELTNLEAIVTGHDQKLGELDVDLITDGCYSLAATLPRLEQNAKRAADDISLLRADYGELRADNEKLRLDTDGLQSGVQQLQSGTEKLRSDALVVRPSVEQIKADTDQLKLIAEQLKSEMTQLRSGSEKSQLAVEKLRSSIQEPPPGDSFLSLKTFTTMNTAVFKTFSGWIDELKKRVDAVEGSIPTLQTVSKQQNDHSSQIKAIEDQVKTLEKVSGQKTTRGLEDSRVPTSVPDQGDIQYERKWKEHDARLKALETISRKSPHRATGAVSEPTDAAEAIAHRSRQNESTNATVAALKAQVAMTDQSIQAISESVRLMRESQMSQSERVGQLENEASTTSRRLGTAEQALQVIGERLDFMQQNFKSLDSQMNNLTTESLFQAIIQYVDKYQPGDAVIGHRVERLLQQMNAYEERLVMLERLATPSEGSANKKRKLTSPHMGQVGMASGNR
ncbi:hypothetical protein LY78DRAFT_460694 [Colletotrichum sublineola]|uniref:Uncharacterized protein n=1 Tax=Colletotrichum sublineola TaxID=1173701 RepID=A0A066WZM1_COLSU|nr:hypothetical protein LY78DRAFT_460694 [Colletotrichum sublineola]KDN62142.1 hypothetical protein CSUB01_00847 [Colletotrichum sublineola]